MSVDRSTAAPRHPQTDPAITVKRFDAPESVLVLDQGRLELITIGGRLVGKGSYAPGWRLSNTLVPPRRAGTGPGEQAGVAPVPARNVPVTRKRRRSVPVAISNMGLPAAPSR